MTQKVVDQHEVLNRWREIADEEAEALQGALKSMKGGVRYGCLCPWDENGTPIGEHGPLCGKSLHEDAVAAVEAALRRYEEARDE